MTNSSYRSVLTSSFVILLVGIIVNFSGLLKELFVAKNFGTSSQLDIFTMGLAIPLFLVGLSGSAMSSVLIPAYIKSKRDEKTHLFFSDVISLILFLSLLLVALSILSTFFLMPYLAAGFNPIKLEKSIIVGIVLAPIILVQNLTIFFDGVLNSGKSSYYNNVIAIFVPLGTIILLVLSGSGSELVLCAGLYLGFITKLVFQISKFLMIKETKFSLSLKSVIFLRNIELIREFGWIIFSSVILGVLPILAQSYAASMQSGDVSSLNYANRLIGVGLLVLSNVINVVFLPFISKEILKDREVGIQISLKLVLIILPALFVLMIPIFFFLTPIVSLIFERGQFDSHSTLNVVTILKYLIWYVPFYIAGMILSRLVIALKKSSIFIVGNIISLIIFTVICSFSVKDIGLGGIGVALTAVYAVSALYLFVQVKKGSRAE